MGKIGKHGSEYESVKDLPRLPNGTVNDYRYAQFVGQGGSRSDPTFDRIKGIHTCCGSKVYWRHKNVCQKLEGSLPPDR